MASIFKRGGKKNRLGNYEIAYFDENGKRRLESTGVPDREVAQQIANKIEAEVALRRKGIITPDMDRYAEAERTPLATHVKDYLDHCRHEGQDSAHVKIKQSQLNKMLAGTSATVLRDLDPMKIERYLQGLVDAGKSFRTHNHNRATIASLAEWLVETGRLRDNPLKLLPKKNEQKDRRRVRRAATDEELSALLAVTEAKETGRTIYYLFAALSGLRVKAVKNATWSDIDFDAGTIRVRVGSAKGKREDQYFALHPQLIEELAKLKPFFTRPHDRIFRTIPRVKTFHRDCERAGVARYDAEGRQLDRHALRTTHGTRIAKAGITPQLGMRMLGHSDMKTTLKHYTDLRISDAAKAIATLPPITAKATESHEAKATGTDNLTAENAVADLLAVAQASLASGGNGSVDTIPHLRLVGAGGDIQNTREIQGKNVNRQGLALGGLNRATSSPKLRNSRAISSVG